MKKKPNIDDFDPKIRKQFMNWVVKCNQRLIREGKLPKKVAK